MLTKLLIAWCLMAVCVAIHATGISLALRWITLAKAPMERRFRPRTALFIRIAGWTILMHLLEIGAWALFYLWKCGMPDFQTATYFSAVTYTTTGYGDVLLPDKWRIVGAVEALTGILMCGWSTGFFFAVVSHLQFGRPPRQDPAVRPGGSAPPPAESATSNPSRPIAGPPSGAPVAASLNTDSLR